jgi:hypothetical protein
MKGYFAVAIFVHEGEGLYCSGDFAFRLDDELIGCGKGCVAEVTQGFADERSGIQDDASVVGHV